MGRLVRKERASIVTRKAIEGVPDLVIEVLSPTNRDDDLPDGPVWRDYACFGMPRYWIVDPEVRTVAQYAHTSAGYGEPTVLRAGDELSSEVFPSIALPVDALFQPWPPVGG